MALLCMLRLLRQLPPDAQPAVHCHVFACPAIGNEALALYVKKMGWERYFSNMLIPGTTVPPEFRQVLKAVLRRVDVDSFPRRTCLALATCLSSSAVNARHFTAVKPAHINIFCMQRNAQV